MKKIYITLLFLLMAGLSYGQQELQMSHYLFDGLYWNPAYAGSNNFIRLSAAYRQQWTEMPGAPKTGMFSFDLPLRHYNMGLGLQVVSDHIGVSSVNEVFANYAYQIKLNKKLSLGMGLRMGVSQYSARLNELLVWDAGDSEFQNNIRNMIIPKFGFGLYLHSDKYYVGISVPTIWAFDGEHQLSMDINKASWWRRHYYLSAAYICKPHKNVSIKPAIMVKYVQNAPLQADLSVMAMYKDFVSLTMGYRTNAAAVAILELRPTKSLRIAYAFDLSMPKYLRIYGGSTHEFMLGYNILSKSESYKSPRYF